MAGSTSGNLSIFALLDALRRRKWLLIIPTILLGIVVGAYAVKQPNRYRAQAVLAAQQLTPPEYLKHVAPAPLHIEDHLWTVREVLFSEVVLSQAVRELNSYKDNANRPTSAADVEALKSGITVTIDGDHTFRVGYEGLDPAEVARVANTLSVLFVTNASVKQEQKTEDTQAIIQKQLEDLKSRLQEEDSRVREYKQEAAMELPEHVDANIRIVDTLREAYQESESRIADEQARRTSITSEMRELEGKGALDEPVIVEKTPAERQLDDLRIKLQELLTRYQPTHPDVTKAQREIENLERAVSTQPKSRRDPSQTYLRYVALQSELEGVEQRIQSYQREQQSLRAQISSFQGRIQAAPRHERALDAMTREMSVGESQLHALLDKQLDTKLAKGLQNAESGVAFAIIEAASVPSDPFSPQRERLILFGILSGLGLGVVMAFLKEQSDTSFGNADDFQSFTTLPLTGVVPNIFGKSKESAEASRQAIVTLNDPESVAAEQYRILAMKLYQQCEQTGTHVVLLTSAAGSEGKSLTAINLGMALASIVDGPVLLLDADMRKPRLHEYLEMRTPADKGFHSLLLRPEVDFNDYIVTLNQLSVIPGAPVKNGNPVAALASPKVRTLFDRLKQQFKLILVDAPPTLPIADSHILSGLCDKVLFVVRARKTPRELFQHAVESFEASNLIGAVLNDVDYERSRYAYAYKYYRENNLARK